MPQPRGCIGSVAPTSSSLTEAAHRPPEGHVVQDRPREAALSREERRRAARGEEAASTRSRSTKGTGQIRSSPHRIHRRSTARRWGREERGGARRDGADSGAREGRHARRGSPDLVPQGGARRRQRRDMGTAHRRPERGGAAWGRNRREVEGEKEREEKKKERKRKKEKVMRPMF